MAWQTGMVLEDPDYTDVSILFIYSLYYLPFTVAENMNIEK